MTMITQSIAVRAPIERVFDVVADFMRYPDFQPEVVKVKVLKRTKTNAEVSFTLNLITRVNYTLRFQLKEPRSITWTLVESDSIVKDNTGSWQLESLESNLTDLTYTMDVEFGMWIPSTITDGLIENHVPEMLKHFKEQAEKAKKARKPKKTPTKRSPAKSQKPKRRS